MADMQVLRERIVRRMAEVDMQAVPVAAAAGFGRDYLLDFLKGRKKTIALTALPKFAEVLHTSEDWLLGKSESHVAANTAPKSEISPSTFPTRRANIAGKVEAGSWREAEDLDQSEARTIDVPVDEEYPNARVLVFEVAGDSMNAFDRAPLVPGALAVCLAYEDVAHRFPPRDGMVVVIQRESDGGHFREWSIKQIEIHDDHMEFHPRSTNQAHKPIVVPIDYAADDGTRVEIIAVLRRVITDTLRF